MIRFLILCLASTYVYAGSNHEISKKNVKSQSSPSSQKTSTQPDDPLLNAINAYAQQYETSATPSKSYGPTTQLYSQQQYPSQPQQYTPHPSFRPHVSSPQLPSTPTLETNFQPMPPAPQHQQHHHQPHIQPQQGPPTPVLMQYLPQSQINDGVQYLQLIPTRPLIVPISPYMSPMAAHQQAYQAPQIITQPQLSDYAGRSLIPSTEPDAASNIPYGLQAYANSLQNYRSYRFNRETSPNNGPLGIILNMNEYMPSPNDAPKTHLVRGRP